MLLAISTTYQPATDLGFLLHKNPARVTRVEMSFGEGVVFYPEATEHRCEVVLLVDVDPVGLVRGKGAQDGTMDQYVNDRPYVASSFMSVALSEAFGTAMNGRSKERQELADSAIPLEATIAAVPCRGGEALLRRLFEPLGYQVHAERLSLDVRFPAWGESSLFNVRLTTTTRLCDLLRHLYVLLPVLDARKHYWVGEAEIEKLFAKGEAWLASHPEKELIVERYLLRIGRLARTALARLDEAAVVTEEETEEETKSPAAAKRETLHQVRLAQVFEVLMENEPRRVIDLGCGEGKLIALLLRAKGLQEIAGMDVASRTLEVAASRLNLDRLSEKQRERLRLFQGSLLYVDERIAGYDAAALVEVIEHIDPSRLPTLERVVFERARPVRVVVTTPNAEYNVMYPSLEEGAMRHGDHRFEWTRAQFADWAHGIAERFGYTVEMRGIGEEAPAVGHPGQMAVFDLAGSGVA